VTRTGQNTIETLYASALAIVAECGLSGLSLRSLAESSRIGVSSITNAAGTKAELLGHLVEMASRNDAVLTAQILGLATRCAPLSPVDLAEFADLALESGLQNGNNLSVFWSELIQASATDADIARALSPWIDGQRGFWMQLSALCPQQNAPLIGEALYTLSVDETAHGLALQAVPAYRRLRRLCLVRLCALDFSGRTEQSQMPLFDHLVAQLGEVSDSVRIDREPIAPFDKRTLIFADAAAHILVFEGAGAVTHRAVAARAHVATSTLSYHFRSREDLLKGAMAFIIQRLKHSLFEPESEQRIENSDDPGYSIARSTYTLALEASRSPQYVGSAADMRRKRGVNLVRQINAQRPAGPHIDALGAQTLALAGIGAILANAYCGVEAATQRSANLVGRLLLA